MTGEGVTRVTALTRRDSTEEGEKGKGERGEGGEEILAEGRTGTPIKGSRKGPRGPKNSFIIGSNNFYSDLNTLS